MNEDSTSLPSLIFDKERFQKQLNIISKAATIAEQKVDYESAHNPEVLRAIDIVEDFLRIKHRICYGGQAINAHLPKKYKFYDPQYNIPDYDFFTPNAETDIKYLANKFYKAGFTEVSAREGMHEGTTKIYINFIPVADITQIDPKLYKIMSTREFRQDGISYLSADTLRMLMYLELSRPEGQVDRWEKVYERLILLNSFVPVERCKVIRLSGKGLLKQGEVTSIMNYIVHEKRIFAGADLIGMYKRSFKEKGIKADWVFSTKRPIYFYSNDLEKDTSFVKYELKQFSPETELSVKKVEALGGDIVPPMRLIMRRGVPVVIILGQTACHSYYNLPVKNDQIMLAASIDTLITLYFSMSMLGNRYLSLASMDCLAKELVEVSYRARMNPQKFPFPFISLDCSGYQKRLPSLIREKAERIKTSRQKLRELITQNTPETVVNNKKIIRKTMKRKNIQDIT